MARMRRDGLRYDVGELMYVRVWCGVYGVEMSCLGVSRCCLLSCELLLRAIFWCSESFRVLYCLCGMLLCFSKIATAHADQQRTTPTRHPYMPTSLSYVRSCSTAHASLVFPLSYRSPTHACISGSISS